MATLNVPGNGRGKTTVIIETDEHVMEVTAPYAVGPDIDCEYGTFRAGEPNRTTFNFQIADPEINVRRNDPPGSRWRDPKTDCRYVRTDALVDSGRVTYVMWKGETGKHSIVLVPELDQKVIDRLVLDKD